MSKPPVASPLFPAIPTKAGDRRFWGELNNSNQALAIASAAQKHPGLTLVITKDTLTAQRLEEEVAFFAEELPVLHLPDWEILPYDTFSPHQDIISQRLYAFSQLPLIERGLLIVPISTLLHKTAPKEFLQANSLIIDMGQTLNVETLRLQLENAGYSCVDNVYEHGEFAVRGAIFDIFPMGEDKPFRIELFDDEVETLRTFDPDTQRTADKIEKIRVLPAKEYPLHKEGQRHFRQNWYEFFETDPKLSSLYTDVSQGIAPAGIEYYLPLFFGELSNLFDFLPKSTLIIHDGEVEAAAKRFRDDVQLRYEDRRHDIRRPLVAPKHLFLNPDELFSALNKFPRVQWYNDQAPERAGSDQFNTFDIGDISINAQAEEPLTLLKAFLDQNQASHKARILFCTESAGRREAVRELLQRIHIRPIELESWSDFITAQDPIGITVAPLDKGLVVNNDKGTPELIVISENQLFGQRIMQRRRRSKSKGQAENIIRDLTELKEGSPVVHLDHGIGRYLGLKTLEIDNQVNEFLMLAYAGESKLYVPVSSLHLISRYGGDSEGGPALNKLGTEKWAVAKRKAQEKIRDTAAELLDIYARREARVGFKFEKPDQDYERFAAAFPFEETPDQQTAIEAVIADMTSRKPMDRLVCGDVGFGKTEVAMRAAFMAVQSGKQVAILVPTTLLAQQHFENFKDRFADWPVQVEVLSRFKSAKETQVALDKMREGKADIVIGTHKLLQKDIVFHELGLLMIDEEHRFGVQQKERIKALRSEVDILTLTATPIPRTLNMAMASVRDLSIIATPPAKRLSVKTFVRQYDKPTVKEALLREVLRGGQVYYLHNEVKSIEKAAREISELIPEARVSIAHGQMTERELESVMKDFYHKRSNVLVCTTIIETGIDIPSANTIIIDRADKFGLAQLHQLRGRVGRSHHQAYAYLLTPDGKKLSKDAEKRLDAIQSAQDLGAGFMLASHDLEIRGAGELLGEEQSGHIQGIGFSLYMEMLEQAVKSIQSGKNPNAEIPLHHGAEVNLHVPSLIPDDYLPDVNSRLTLYKRISNAQNDNDLRELQVEMIDRFGLLPEQVKNLFKVTALKLQLTPLGIQKLDAGPESGRIEFGRETNIDPFRLIQIVQTRPATYKLEGGQALKFIEKMPEIDQRLAVIERLLLDLQKDPNSK
ncbi:MAG: transcription-repair coupling factor (superfamily II helicase) [Oleispira sp.]|jgi:transcription-repair coupling factor (superfamily II helicase)